MGRIDRLIVCNFKSYGGEQKIGPFRRFQCIIGPNGSGKSNLMDAISFVLGVQTQQLRGSKLIDLVHLKENELRAETKRSAYVELVYVDEEGVLEKEKLLQDGKEVYFRRTIRQNGSAVYSINGKEVSAKGYQDVLKNIGILVKARNFLVFQGDVANIAQKSPSEITKMFEEISGSNFLAEKYAEKQEACEAAEEEVLRTFNKKKSVAKEKKQVQEQKQEAEMFQKMVEDLNIKKSEFFLWQLHHAEKNLQANEQKCDNVNENLDILNEEIEEVQSKLKEHQRASGKFRREALSLEKKITKQKRQVEKANPQKISLSAQIASLREGAKKAEKERKKLEKSEKKQKQKVESLMSQLEDIQEEKNKFEAEESQDENIIQAERLEEYNRKKQEVGIKTAQIQQELDEVLKAFSQKEKVREKTETEIKVLNEAKENSKQAHKYNNDKRLKLEKHCADHQKNLDNFSSSLAGLTRTSEDATERLKEVRQQLEKYDQKLFTAQEHRQKSKREAQKSECIDTLKRVFKGVRGRFHELCDLTRREYGMAVTIALGKNMDAIVVDEEKVAIECIKYLKEQRLGKEIFIPLDTIRIQNKNQDHFRKLGGSFKLLTDVFKYDEDNHKALLYACGNMLLCDTQEEAKGLCYAPGNEGKYKVITKDGTIFHKSGSMSGGFSKKDQQRTNKWNDKEIAKVQHSRNRLREELLTLERKERTERPSRELQAQIDAVKQRLHFSKMDLEHITKRVTQFENDITRMDEELVEKKTSLQKMQAEIAKDRQKIDAFRKRISKVSVTVFAEFSKSVGVKNIAEYEEKRLAAAESRAKRKIELAEAESRLLGDLEYQKSRDNEKAAKELKKKIQNLKAKLDEKERTLENFDADQEKKKQDMKHDEKILKELRNKLVDADAEVTGVKSSEQELKKKLTKLERKKISIEAESEKLASLRSEVIKQADMNQVQLPRVERKHKKGVKDADHVEFDYSLVKENTDVKDENEYDRIKQRYMDEIASTETDIQKISPNMKAFEQYNAVEERLKSMKDDFDKKRTGQKDIVTEFEAVLQERTETFMRMFTHVKENIDDVYKALTKSQKHPLGGNAYLNLEDEEKPFLSGIKYNAMPPGKRFRDMDQLSGGEKTVAALALLFAIHSCHPAPFFVLDEVDAALDSANVNKVSNYVRSRTREEALQCIVISLKDTFYHKADALVGIYKDQEEETSGSLTVDLSQYGKNVKLSHSAIFGTQDSSLQDSAELKASPTPSRSSRKRHR